MKNFSHINQQGKAKMVNVGSKENQQRIAKAEGQIYLNSQTLALIKQNQIQKGDVLTVAKIAGIQAAKQTANLIPLCHQLILDNIEVELIPTTNGITATSTITCIGRTGVEMEALTAVNAALLTIYDMCKAVDKNMVIGEIMLISKEKHDL